MSLGRVKYNACASSDAGRPWNIAVQYQEATVRTQRNEKVFLSNWNELRITKNEKIKSIIWESLSREMSISPYQSWLFVQEQTWAHPFVTRRVGLSLV